MKETILILLFATGIWFYNNDIQSINVEDNISYQNEIVEETINNNNIKIINLENIKLGDSKNYLISQIGNPSRIDESEYDFNWYVYNQDLSNFAMVGIANDEVVAIYSNSINSKELEGIILGDNKEAIRNTYTPIKYKKKNNTRYMINSDEQYDIIEIENKYITLFYDIYENDKICSYQIIDEKSEKTLDGIYANDSYELRKSFELQTLDLVNSTRVRFDLSPLEYSENATISARLHSEDMIYNNFFDHNNKKNETPFDRMKKEGIVYRKAGENIAAGQSSAIYAHEAWMNSLGHRKNILGDYKYMGTGVIFGGNYSIYYTQNFYM